MGVAGLDRDVTREQVNEWLRRNPPPPLTEQQVVKLRALGEAATYKSRQD